MTKREAAIISAYTGVFIGSFDELHKYIEELLKRQVMTHELAERVIQNQIMRLSKKDFIKLTVN